MTATRNVDQAIGDVDRCTDDTGRAAAAVLEEMAALAGVSRKLSAQVSEVIARIRSAQAA